MRNYSKLGFRLLSVIILSSVFVFSQDYYVSNSLGSDTNSGSLSSPFKTINKGVSMVNAGGTVYVMAGIYQNENYGAVDISTNTNMNNPHVVNINKSGAEGSYITLRNYPGDSPKIEFDGQGGILIANNMNYIIIEGFEVEGPSASITYDQAIADRNYKIQLSEDDDESTNYNNTYFNGKGIWGGYGAHNNVIIKNNNVYNTPGSAIRFNDSDYITIENNRIYNSTWWTSSASSAIVFAETIASEDDNTSDIKMIIRGNTVFNNWNRIPFYAIQLPDNANPPSSDYGTAEYNNILDGQGIYVTRSDPEYNGTFLFENNLCVNNGKNGINFDHSESSSAIYQNNTLYYNGVHEIIQDISVSEGNPAHNGQNVAGIKANNVLNATVVNNIIVTRNSQWSALQLNDVYGTRIALNNIIVNGTYAWPATEENNLINIDPLFIFAPETVDGPIDMSGTDFSLTSESPAIDAGNTGYSPINDIEGNLRPSSSAISSSSFENSTGGWTAFGSTITIETSSNASLTGEKSLLTTGRTENWHSPRIILNDLLTVGESYTIYIWVKLAEGVSGTSQLTVKNIDETSYDNLTSQVEVSDQQWTQLTADYTYADQANSFLYVKGPLTEDGVGGDYYIDDFSIVAQGASPVDFTNADDIVDIGAYEYVDSSMSSGNSRLEPNYHIYPNPTLNYISIKNLDFNSLITIYNLAGQLVYSETNSNNKNETIDLSGLNSGIYLLNISNNNNSYTYRIIKK